MKNGMKLVGFLGLLLAIGAADAGGPQVQRKTADVKVANVAAKAKKTTLSPAQARSKLLQREAKFVENKGQWDARGKFVARTPGMDMWFESRGIDFDYWMKTGTMSQPHRRGDVVRLSFPGGTKHLSYTASHDTGSHTDYLVGKHQASNVRSYRDVYSANIYQGIDLHAHFQGAEPRYDFVVARGADPKAIRLRFDGAKKVTAKGSSVVFNTSVGDRKQGSLSAYQTVNGHKRNVEAKFVAIDAHTLGLKLGAYDRNQSLVIDPLVYGSYYGGDDGFDEVRSVAEDSDGGVFLTGATQSPYFPVIYGPYSWNIAPGAQNAFMSKLQGDAYNHDYAAFVGGSIMDWGQFVKIDPLGNVWMVGTTKSPDFIGGIPKKNVQFLGLDFHSDTVTVTGGNFHFIYGPDKSPALPYNPTAAQVAAALNTMPSIASHVISVTPLNGSSINDFGVFEITLDSSVSSPIQVIDGRYIPNSSSLGYPVLPPVEAPLEPTYVATTETAPISNGNDLNYQVLSNVGTTALWGSFTITVQTVNAGTVTTSTTTPLRFNATATNQIAVLSIQTALRALGNVGATGCTVTQTSGGSIANTGNLMHVHFTLTAPNQVASVMTVMSNPADPLLPGNIRYETHHSAYSYALPFHRDSNTVLSPLPTHMLVFGSEFQGNYNWMYQGIPNCSDIWGMPTELLNSFDVRQDPNPIPNEPIDLVFGGTAFTNVPEMPANTYPGGVAGFMLRYTYDSSAGTYTLKSSASKYIGFGDADNRGVALDLQGNTYITGTVFGNGNTDTSSTPGVFTTTAGVWQNGRLSENLDIYVQKYDSNGNLIWSGLLGGHGNDEAGGIDVDLDGTTIPTGSAIALDPYTAATSSNPDIYVTGISRSYDYPRTRGVFGEVFTDADNVVVTKVSNDGSSILYSTNLRESSIGGTLLIRSCVLPAGIAVDQRGQAYVSGNMHFKLGFPDETTAPPTPDQPNAVNFPSMPTTGDAFSSTWNAPAPPELPTTEPFMDVLNSSATGLVFGSYLGGKLDDRVYAPYVDSFGDVWVMGWTESGRFYAMSPTIFYLTNNSYLPAGMINRLAFKSYPDSSGLGGGGGHTAIEPTDVMYGELEREGFSQIAPAFPVIQTLPYFFGPTYGTDGWLIRLRLGLPAVQSVTLNPSTIPGGGGAFSTGTVTLTQAAPAGGAIVLVSVPSGSPAAFSPTDPTQLSTTVTIPSGGTTGTFTIYSEDVGSKTPVTVEADYQNTFQKAVLNVIPWLETLQVAPTTVVGGNTISGTITLAAPAPTGGLAVTLASNPVGDLVFQNDGVVTVPAGQSSVAFTFSTIGVNANTPVTFAATSHGFTIYQALTLTPASLLSLTFNPASIPGGNSSTGTVTFNGLVGGTQPITITITDPDSSFIVQPTTLTVQPQSGSATFTVTAPLNPAEAQLTFTASMAAQNGYPAQQVSGNLLIDNITVSSFTLDTSEIPSGGTANGTVVLSKVAPAGGVVLNVTTSNAAIANPQSTTVTVAAGQTQASFPIQGGFVAANATATIGVNRGGASTNASLTVDALPFGLSLSPTDILGGQSSLGTITIGAPAPAGGLTFQVSASPSGLVTLSPTNVTILAGQTQGTFQVTSNPVQSSTTVNVFATWTDALGVTAPAVSQTLGLEPVGVQSITFNPYTVKQRLGVTQCTITLSGPAPAGGALVTISQNPTLLIGPSTVSIAAGQTSISFNMRAGKVSRTLTDTVTATYNGSVSAVVTVLR